MAIFVRDNARPAYIPRVSSGCNRMTKRMLLSVLVLLLSGSVRVYAQRSFVYTNDNLQQPVNTVTGFSVADNGVLTRLPGSPVSTGGGGDRTYDSAMNILASSSREFLFAANAAGGTIGSNSITVFEIDPRSGALMRVPGSPFASGLANPVGLGLTETPDGRFLIVSGVIAAELTVMSVAANGSLKPVPGSTVSLDSSLGGVEMTADGRFLAVALLDGGVAMYAVGSDGTLSAVAGSPFATSGFGFPSGVEINCAGDLLFVAEDTSYGFVPNVIIDTYRIAPDGALTPVAGSPFTRDHGGQSYNLRLSADNRFLYLANSTESTVTAFAVTTDGGLSEISGSPFPTGSGFTSGSPSSLSVNADEKLLYAPNISGSVTVFHVGADGSLTLVSSVPFEPGHPSAANWVAAWPPKACRPSNLSIQCPTDIAMPSELVEEGVPGAIVQFTQPQATSDCLTPTVVCLPASGSFFASGVTTVTCSTTDACGNAASCSFTVSVGSPFDGSASICVADDASGDTFAEVVDSASPFYGFWTYRVAATGGSVSGTASSVQYVAGQSLASRDNDYSAENTAYSMRATIKLSKGSGRVMVKKRRSPTKYVLQDRDLSNDPPCASQGR